MVLSCKNANYQDKKYKGLHEDNRLSSHQCTSQARIFFRLQKQALLAMCSLLTGCCLSIRILHSRRIPGKYYRSHPYSLCSAAHHSSKCHRFLLCRSIHKKQCIAPSHSILRNGRFLLFRSKSFFQSRGLRSKYCLLCQPRLLRKGSLAVARMQSRSKCICQGSNALWLRLFLCSSCYRSSLPRHKRYSRFALYFCTERINQYNRQVCS